MVKHEPEKSTKLQFKELILLFCIPISIILTLIAFLYIPRLFANPSYDFIYCTGYSCKNAFSVDPTGKVLSSGSANSSGSGLYYYDAERDASRPLYTNEVDLYKLDPTSKSPDGYILKRSSQGGGFLFWGNHSNEWILIKGMASKPVTIESNEYYNEFIGWVLR